MKILMHKRIWGVIALGAIGNGLHASEHEVPLSQTPAIVCTEKKQDGVLRVVTFNIRLKVKEKNPENLWCCRLPLVVEIIRATQPDVIGLQEATFTQMSDLEEALACDGYTWCGEKHSYEQPMLSFLDNLHLLEATNKGSSYNAIMYNTKTIAHLQDSTFWLNAENKRGFTGWGSHVPRTCTWAKFKTHACDRPFIVFNTHLDPSSDEARQKGAELIAAKIKEVLHDKEPIFLLGDFSASETSEVGKVFTDGACKMTNVRHIAPLRSGPQATFTGWGAVQATVDHIFMTNNSRTDVLNFSVIERVDKKLASDHRPVCVDVALS